MPSEIRYELAMPRPETHLFEVRMRLTDLAEDALDLVMPAWTPGSYLIRDYARHVQDFEARAGEKSLPWTRVDKQKWRVETKGARSVNVQYRVYANDFSVQTSHLDRTHGLVNGTSVFIHARGLKDRPCTVRVKPPRGWHVDTGLPGERNAFRARDYDHLVDCPMEIGTHRRLTFRVKNKDHVVALYGEGNEDPDRITRDLKRIVEEAARVFGELPYDRYVFIVHLTDKAGGGLEHENSNVSKVNRWTFAPDKDYDNFLGLEAHEFFHTWNVKRIRPTVLGPFDYEREIHTTLLWAMEGLTSYYDHLLLVRAGLLPETRYRDYLGKMITKLRKQPGRFVMSLEESSHLTWVKLYKMDENWPNTGISYYLKGELLGLVLDLTIRKRTKGKKSLDDVFRQLWKKHGKTGIGIDEGTGWRAALEEATGLNWGDFWRKYISGTEELPFETALASAGWRVEAVEKGAESKGDKGEYEKPGAWIGVDLSREDNRVRVKSLAAGGPAQNTGLAAGDEIVALDGYRVDDPAHVGKRLRERTPGDPANITFFRRDQLMESTVRTTTPPPDKWKVEERQKESAATRRFRAQWLRSPRRTGR